MQKKNEEKKKFRRSERTKKHPTQFCRHKHNCFFTTNAIFKHKTVFEIIAEPSGNPFKA
jgi:hypothetical protein